MTQPKSNHARYQELKAEMEQALEWQPGEANRLSPGMLREIVRSSRAPGVIALREEFLRLLSDNAEPPVWLEPIQPKRCR